MNKAAVIFLILILTLILCSCGTLSEPVQTISAQASDVLENKENVADEQKGYEEQEVTYYTKETLEGVLCHSLFSSDVFVII